MKQVYLYARINTTAQTDNTLADQVEQLIRYARERDYQVMGVFTDVCASAEIHRSGFDRIVNSLTWTHGITVVALRPDRIARGFGEYMHLLAKIEKTNEELEFVSGEDPNMAQPLIDAWLNAAQ